MHGDSPAGLSDHREEVLARLDRDRPWTLVIDGRSGAGKSSLATAIAAETHASIVCLDELYPGWGGLTEGAALALSLVMQPRAEGRPARYRRFDWQAGTFAGDPIVVAPDQPLIVEGCGAITSGSSRLADLTVWLDGDADERKRRALRRDGDSFAPHWDAWARQERDHLRQNDPVAAAGLCLTMAPSDAFGPTPLRP